MAAENQEKPDGPEATVKGTSDRSRHFITSLARGFEVLRSFRPGERFLGNQEIARRTGLPKSTVSRLTATLTELGYLKHSKNLEKYYLGTAVLSLGYSLLGNMEIRQIARPMMHELADHAQASVAIGARDRHEMVYVENCRCSATSFTLRLDVGSHIPIATTAMGRAYLCGLPDRERDHLLDQLRVRNGSDWPKIRAGFEQALREYQDRGFCLSVGDWQKDVNAVAVPFVPADGSEVFAFNCGGPAFQLRRHMLEDNIGPHLVALVRNVQAEAYRRH
ncbi:IclR family transcriptional regulator [Geobacter sp.]|uniref:IclR family transcriptional regulator n=1 Tax=Geobacter sp. TaxID=46610 RepID=UPI0026116E93|nr:IclR family transcriptional regulator [Geobacter sp.]